MIIFKSRTPMESKRVNLGSFLVVVSIFIIAPKIYIGLGMLVFGVLLISIQYKTKIDL